MRVQRLGLAKPGWRCNHCHGKQRGHFRVTRKDRDVYDEVLAYVTTLQLNPEVKPYGFTKEELAVRFQVKEHCVEQALARLNREGLVQQPVHEPPHDSNRNLGHGYGPDSSWVGDRYLLVKKPPCETPSK